MLYGSYEKLLEEIEGLEWVLTCLGIVVYWGCRVSILFDYGE